MDRANYVVNALGSISEGSTLNSFEISGLVLRIYEAFPQEVPSVTFTETV